MIVDEQIQSYRIHFELTKPTLQSGFVGTMKLIINFVCQLKLDPELMERMHMNSTTQSKCDSLLTREPARFKTLLLKVKRFIY